MKRPLWTALALGIASSVILAACGPTPPTPQAATTALPTAVPASTGIVASAEVTPVQEIHIAFSIPGTIKEVNVKEGDQVGAGETLITLDATAFESAVAQAEAALYGQQREYEFWLQPRKGQNPERRELEAAKLEAAKATLTLAQAQLAQATLSAPMEATVVSVDVQPGEYTQPGQVVVTLATLDHLRIETTDLSERDLPRVQVGQTATVFIEALNQDFTGTIIAIAPRADTVGGDVVYKVTVELNEQPEGLRWGMSAEVHIETE